MNTGFSTILNNKLQHLHINPLPIYEYACGADLTWTAKGTFMGVEFDSGKWRTKKDAKRDSARKMLEFVDMEACGDGGSATADVLELLGFMQESDEGTDLRRNYHSQGTRIQTIATTGTWRQQEDSLTRSSGIIVSDSQTSSAPAPDFGSLIHEVDEMLCNMGSLPSLFSSSSPCSSTLSGDEAG
ncbi:hypothetical protein HDU93_001416 [Gonapodya sp. JEL0774]|nr:hypothetical protein HDU93_001416 [Gonapodya sp. JEL0774]